MVPVSLRRCPETDGRTKIPGELLRNDRNWLYEKKGGVEKKENDETKQHDHGEKRTVIDACSSTET